MSQMNRRRALQLLAALGTTGFARRVWLATADAEPTRRPSAPTIKIGLIAPQTGGYKSIGDDITNGFQLFLDLHDQRLGGHPVELLTADEGDTAKTGKAAVEGLLKQGVLALTGVVNSAVMVGIRDTVEQARVPLIGSNASPSSLQSVVYIWRTSYVQRRARPGARPLPAPTSCTSNGRVGIIAPDNVGGPRRRSTASGTSSASAQRPAPRRPGDGPSSPPAPARDRSARTSTRRWPGNPTAIYCFFAGQAAVEFIRQLRGEGYRGPIYAPGFLTEGDRARRPEGARGGKSRPR